MKKIVAFGMSLILISLLIIGCGKDSDKLAGRWYRQEDQELVMSIYDDGTCQLSDDSSICEWSIVNKNQLKIDLYGDSIVFTIKKLSKKKLILEGYDGESVTLIKK